MTRQVLTEWLTEWRHRAEECEAVQSADPLVAAALRERAATLRHVCEMLTPLTQPTPSAQGSMENPIDPQLTPEQEGIEAGLNGCVSTHNPYLLREGMEAQREAWGRGNARVRAAYDNGYAQGRRVAELEQPPAEPELEAHWKAGFLRGAKFWYGKGEQATMWQSEQNECWRAANRLWPSVRPESIEDARQISRAALHKVPQVEP